MATINLDAILAAATPAEQVVPMCLSGKIRRRYDEIAARVAERAESREQQALAARAAATLDDRLGNRAGSDRDGNPPPPADVRDVEQDALDQAEAEMRKHTVPFLIRAVSSQKWNELLEAHPPRKEPGSGRVIPADIDGINSKTFYPDLVKLSIAEPEMDDAQYERVMSVLSDAQFNRLAKAAAECNNQDADIPFSLSGSENPPA